AVARVYCQPRVISHAKQRTIKVALGCTFKLVRNDAPNATDDSLIQSSLTILKQHPEITHVLLITGDFDYHVLTNQLLQQLKSVVLIGQTENFNTKLVSRVHEFLSVSFIASFPSNWWTQEPQAELDAISRLADTSNLACIDNLLAHIAITKPYQSAAALKGLAQVFSETFPDKTQKLVLARTQQVLSHFRLAAQQVRNQFLIERTDSILSKIT
ncbi:MAG: hypothetical protein RBG13Loki_1607, partial [Promethearchaeota archaeon CR_4]